MLGSVCLQLRIPVAEEEEEKHVIYAKPTLSEWMLHTQIQTVL